MVKVAIAGYGQLAQEIVAAIQAEGQHEILILSRKEPPSDLVDRGVRFITVEYGDKTQLVEALQGVHTVLSFILVGSDVGSVSQRNLIDASIVAGVQSYDVKHYPIYQGKLEIRDYLQKLNAERKVLEYCLFLPGMFLNYLGPAHRMNKNLTHSDTFIDLKNRRAILPQVPNASLSLTKVEDVASIVAKALSFEGEWPVIGGISANKVTVTDIIKIGEKVRGGQFSVERVDMEDLRAVEEIKIASEQFAIQSLLSTGEGGWELTDEWNRLLPDLPLEDIETFLNNVWEGEL
ncbi:hypothetical protein K4K60_011560 [Colletotrichum sp. SAR11_57]|nr:hypothetical protein K4K60_011560 [Colletotrichum sp. SAR11_57]